MGTVDNIFPVEAWRRNIGYHPLHFWQIKDDDVAPVTSSCNALVYQYAWQNTGQLGRSEIAKYIATAEARLFEHLHYHVGRHFVDSRELQYPFPRTGGHEFKAHIGGRGRWLNVRLDEGYIRNLGVETYTAVETGSTVTYSDEDDDGIDETFTVTASTTLTDADQIGVYFASGDRLNGEGVSEKWRVAPVDVTISGGTVTIKGKRWQLVKPIKYEGFSTGALEATTDSNFVTTLDIYRRWCDPDGNTNDTCQALLIWETEPYPRWAISCLDTDTVSYTTNAQDPAAVAYGIARAGIRDSRLGEITVGRAVYDSDEDEWKGTDWGTCRQPDRVIVRYEAGARLPTVESTLSRTSVDGRWDEIVTRLAAAEMTRRICACDIANQELYRWQFDLARAAGANDEQYRISDRHLSNPLGTKAGQVYAWERVQHLGITQAFLV